MPHTERDPPARAGLVALIRLLAPGAGSWPFGPKGNGTWAERVGPSRLTWFFPLREVWIAFIEETYSHLKTFVPHQEIKSR